MPGLCYSNHVVRKVWPVLVVLLAVAVGGVWFWSLGSLPTASLAAADVEWQRAIADGASPAPDHLSLTRQRNDLHAERMGTPGSLRYQFVLWSEQLHAQTLKAEARASFRQQELERRLIGLQALADQGMPGNAANEYARLQNDLTTVTDATSRFAYLAGVNRVLVLMGDVGPSAGSYRLKQQLEDLQVTLARDPSEALLARLFAASDRLQEAAAAIAAGNQALASQTLDSAGQSLANLDRDSTSTVQHPASDQDRVLATKLSALHDWTTALRRQAIAMNLPVFTVVQPPVAATSTLPLPAVSSTPAVPEAATSTAATTTTAPIIPKKPPTPPPPVPASTLQVSASQTTIGFFKTLHLTATLISADGTRSDVTSRTTFSPSDLSLGSLTGNAFQSGQTPGTVVITGTYVDNGAASHASVDVTIAQ